MAKIRKELNHGHERWVVDWYDPHGERRREFFPTKGEANHRLSDVLKETGERLTPVVDARCTLRAYAAHWLAGGESQWKPRTLRSYRDTLKLHVLEFPVSSGTTLGDVRVTRLKKRHVRALVVAKRREGRARDSVRIIF